MTLSMLMIPALLTARGRGFRKLVPPGQAIGPDQEELRGEVSVSGGGRSARATGAGRDLVVNMEITVHSHLA